MHMTFTHNMPELLAGLDDVEKRQVPQALAWALNDMAQEALEGVQADMRQNFDRPTPYTVGGGRKKGVFVVRRANKRTLVAEVIEHPDMTRKHFLKVQERGGPRPRTAMETAFNMRMPYEGNIQSVIPAQAALRDAFGNWSAGERNRVRSAVRAQSDKQMNSGRSPKVKAKSAKQFFVPRLSSKLSPGVWRRTSRGAKLQKVLHFSEKVPTYKPRLGFIKGAKARAERNFPRHYARSLQRALNSAFGPHMRG